MMFFFLLLLPAIFTVAGALCCSSNAVGSLCGVYAAKSVAAATTTGYKTIVLKAVVDSDKMGKSLDVDMMMTFDRLEKYANVCGLRLQIRSTGPYLRIEAFPTLPSSSLAVSMPQPQPIGYLTAFIRPFPPLLFHLDTIQVKNRRQSLSFKREGWTIDGPGISFLMGSYALLWAYQRGCRRTELLAINDSDKMHRILVRLYKSFGFSVMREVGDDGNSISDRLLWGGVGTLMEMDITSFMKKWSRLKLEGLIHDAKEKRIEFEQNAQE